MEGLQGPLVLPCWDLGLVANTGRGLDDVEIVLGERRSTGLGV